MGRVIVRAADIEGDRLTRLQVQLGSLPARVIDRDTAVAWMRDGHSFLPSMGAGVGPAWQLVEVGEDAERFVRNDTALEAADAVGDLPSVTA